MKLVTRNTTIVAVLLGVMMSLSGLTGTVDASFAVGYVIGSMVAAFVFILIVKLLLVAGATIFATARRKLS